MNTQTEFDLVEEQTVEARRNQKQSNCRSAILIWWEAVAVGFVFSLTSSQPWVEFGQAKNIPSRLAYSHPIKNAPRCGAFYLSPALLI